MRYVHLGSALVVLFASACASTPAPHDKVASSAAAIRAADEVGAGGVPQSSAYLQSARDEYEQGRNLMRDGNNHEATSVLLRSQADAELALAAAREAKTHASAQQAVARVQALRSQTGTAVGGGPTSPDTTRTITAPSTDQPSDMNVPPPTDTTKPRSGGVPSSPIAPEPSGR
jgi:Domain of unknown function (DUF4398)